MLGVIKTSPRSSRLSLSALTLHGKKSAGYLERFNRDFDFCIQCDGAFFIRDTYDAKILCDYYMEKFSELPDKVKIFQSSYVLNANYAGTNQILAMLGYEQFQIKYELCEIIICTVNNKSLMADSFNSYTISYDAVSTFRS